MQAVRALGVGLLLLSAYLWSRTVTVTGEACGTLYDLWRGSWSPPNIGGDATKACLDHATFAAVAANGLLLLGFAAMLVGTIALTRRTLTRPLRWGAEIAMALSWGVLTAALAMTAALYLDSGPICGWYAVGEVDDYVRHGADTAMCLAAGGGVLPGDYGPIAMLTFPIGVVLWVVITTCARISPRRSPDVIRTEHPLAQDV
jgi:type IV secretory pathway TrbD component